MEDLLKRVTPAFLIIIFFFLGIFVYTKISGPISLSVSSNVTNKTDTFTVTGEGTVSVQPDIAYINVGINKTATTVKQAQSQTNEIINRVIAGLKTLGIDAKNIKTVSYYINPNYDWNNGTQKITGYSASTQLKVKITDIDKVNDVIDAATSSGANQVDNINFDVEDRESSQETARKQAVDEANRKAEAAAKAAGFKLGKIVSYSESSNDNVIVPIMYNKSLAVADQASGNSTNVQSGSQDIRIIVNLSYQIY